MLVEKRANFTAAPISVDGIGPLAAVYGWVVYLAIIIMLHAFSPSVCNAKAGGTTPCPTAL